MAELCCGLSKALFLPWAPDNFGRGATGPQRTSLGCGERRMGGLEVVCVGAGV